MPTKFESVRQMALALGNVQESTSYGTPAFKVDGKLFARLRPELNSLVVLSSFDERQELMEADPDTYYITDHYLNYEWVLVRLNRIRPEALKDMLSNAQKAAAKKLRRR